MAKIIDLAQVRRNQRELSEEERARYAEHRARVDQFMMPILEMAHMVDEMIEAGEDAPDVMTALQEACGVLFASAVYKAFDPDKLPDDICDVAADGVSSFMMCSLITIHDNPPDEQVH